MFPVNQRWLSALRAEDRVWTPTLYLGLLPLVLALTVWRLRTPDCRVRWLSWMAIGSLVASFGWYGPGVLLGAAQKTWIANPQSVMVGEPTGGLYWLMVTLLPGYTYFRYPAKLLVIASLAVTLLSAIGFERVFTSSRETVCRWLARLGIVSLAAGGVIAVSGICWSDCFERGVPDELFGPLDLYGAWSGCLLSCAHAVLLCGLLWWLLRHCTRSAVQVGSWILMITSLELVTANGWLVLTAPSDAMQAEAVLESRKSNREVVRLYRPPQRAWVPPKWLETHDARRGEQSVRWDRATLFPKYHLLGYWGSVQSQSTMVPRDYRAFLQAGGVGTPRPEILDALATRYLVLPAPDIWPATRAQECLTRSRTVNVRVWRNPQAFPRAWIVHQVDRFPLEPTADPARLRNRYRTILFPAGIARDLRQVAVIPSEVPVDLQTGEHLTPSTSAETCRLLSEQACHLELEATLTAPGMVVLSNLFDRSWSVQVFSDPALAASDEGTSTEILRANGIMQGVVLPPGTHRLKFQYTPRALFWAAGVSCLSWLLISLMVMRSLCITIISRRAP